MIRGERIDARFDISEVLPPKSAHVREESFAVRSSRVGRKITGARWSGPRFFGLRQRPRDSTSTARTGHGAG